jgi:hypothetical protein
MSGSVHRVLTPDFPVTGSTVVTVEFSIMNGMPKIKPIGLNGLSRQYQVLFNDALTHIINYYRDETKKCTFDKPPGTYKDQCIGTIKILIRQRPKTTTFEYTFGEGVMFFFASKQSRDPFFEKVKDLLMTCYQSVEVVTATQVKN